MSDTRIVYTRPDGGISVVAYEVKQDEKEADVLQRVLTKDIPADATDVQIMKKQDIESAFGDRWFRNAWRCTKGALHIPLDAAKEAHRQRIRDARTMQWDALDREQLRALGRGDGGQVQVIETKKQALRDAPADPRIDAATSLDELKAIWHPELPSKKEVGI